MKFIFTLASLVALLAPATATIRTVTCQNSPTHFLPVTVNAVCGDTIRWTWVAGNHVVGPQSASNIPSGAAMFNAPIDVSHTSFQYVVTVAGSYNYQCHPATPHGEPGYIVVTCGTGITSLMADAISSAYPNPCQDKFTIETTGADLVSVYNLLGEKIRSVSFNNGQTKTQIDVAGLSPGIYFYSLIKEGITVETRKFVKE